jgi:methylenetetrahydrofolate dehydrogenase (NADP+)/methenyltetrahydrofolate cyclohydrolase
VAVLLDGKATAEKVRARLKTEIAAMRSAGLPQPRAVFIQLGDNPASTTYVDTKHRMARRIGCASGVERYAAEMRQHELLARLAALNADPEVHAILVQLPLPEHIDTQAVIRAIDPAKDVDCFHPVNAGQLLTGLPGPKPATPQGILMLLDEYEIPIAGRRAVVVGRSNLVGKPLGIMLLARDATVTYCHSKTPDLAAVLREADIVVAATGRAGLVTAGMVKPGAAVVDVGTNYVPVADTAGEPLRDSTGSPELRLCGDVAFDEVEPLAGWISPVPGGVGPMTIASVLFNTLVLYKQQINAATADVPG